MKAIAAQSAGLEQLIEVELPTPVPGARDLLVEVRAVAVNPVDVKVRARMGTPPGAPRVLGWDAAGIVVDTGPDATLFRRGDAVYFAGDIRRDGCNSEYCAVDERIVGHKPRTLDFAQAAALPLTAITAYEAFFDRMHVPRGEGSRGKTLLIIGGAGGVGSIATQLAKALTGTTVIATASRPESAAWAESMGAAHVVDHTGDLGTQLAAVDAPQPDYILCTSDTDPYARRLFDLVAPQGTICFIVPPSVPLDMAPLHAKSAIITWELMYTRSMFGTADLIAQHRLLEELAELVDEGRIRTTLRERLAPLCARTLREAHGRVETHAAIGKIAIEGWA